ncbi:hypothetical protein [Methylomonas sp. AM2-LC]|uniref:hypothetical protein n=1 Tax=Methylomonas sp. AM2-LC TaxID=3153301 RepID=UPI003263F031
MKISLTLPSPLTPTSLSAWLENIKDLPISSSFMQMYDTLKQLSKLENDLWEFYPLLLDYTPNIFLQANSFVEYSNLLAKQKSIKLAQLGAELIKLLSKLFCRLAESNQLDLRQRQLASYYALQFIGYNLRNDHLLHQLSSNVLWKKTAKLYKISIECNDLETFQIQKIQIFKFQPNIISVIKRNLLFSLFKATRYASTDIKEFFRLSNQHYDLLDINPSYTSNSSYYWDQKNLPQAVNASKHSFAKDVIKIDCHRFVEALRDNKITTKLRIEVQHKLIHQLTGYKQVLADIHQGDHYVSQLLVGFESVCQYFQALDKTQKISILSRQLNPVNLKMDTLALWPIEQESPFYQFNTQPSQQLLQGDTVNIMQSENNVVVFTEKYHFDTSIGDLSLLYKHKNSVSLCIIRQNTMHEGMNIKMTLLELVSGYYSIYNITSVSGKNLQALIINETSNNPEAFLPAGQYKINGKITLNIGKTFYLMTCLEHSQYFCRFRIRFK